MFLKDPKELTYEPTFIKVPFSKDKFMLDFIKYAQPSELGMLSENIVEALYQFNEPDTRAYDFKSITGKIEIKSSRAYSHKGKRSMCTIAELNTDESYDCNIQHVKKKLFNFLYYMVFCKDGLQIFRVKSRLITRSRFGYSDSQQRNHKGNGQFHINSKNYPVHKDFLAEELPYKFVYDLLKNQDGFVDRVHA